jgi:hypothetical protein
LSLSGERRGGTAYLAVVFVLASASLAWRCAKPAPQGERPSASASAGTARGSSAALAVEHAHDFGRVTEGDTLQHGFVLRNTTGVAQSLEDVREVLGCAAVPVPRVLEPNQAGKLEVTCRANVRGPLRVSLPLRANGRSAGELSVAAEVEPLLAFDHALLEVRVPFGAANESGARLRGTLARRARLTPVEPPPAGMAVDVLSTAGDAGERVVLRVDRAPVGVHVGSLRFATGLAQPKAIELPYSVKVTGTLTVSPTNPVLDLAAPDGTRAVVVVTSAQPGFMVERAEVLEGPFSARVRRDGDGFRIEVTLVEARLSTAASGVNGRIRIVSNDRTEPSKILPLFALGRPPGRAQAAPSSPARSTIGRGD